MTEKKTLWLTVEQPTEDEMQSVVESLEDTPLSEKYELVVTSDGLDTMSKEDIEHVIDRLQGLYE